NPSPADGRSDAGSVRRMDGSTAVGGRAPQVARSAGPPGARRAEAHPETRSRTMLTSHMAEHGEAALVATGTGTTGDLAGCLAHFGVSSELIRAALAMLPMMKSVVLYRPSETDAWELGEAAAEEWPNARGGVVGVARGL